MRVTVTKAFTHGGHLTAPGTRINVPPIEAAILCRRGLITLSDGAHREPFEPDPEPEPDPDPEPEDDAIGDAPSDAPAIGDPATDEPGPARRRRSYRRRDLTPEP